MPDTLAWYEAVWIVAAACGLAGALAGVGHALHDRRAVSWFAQNDRRRLIAGAHLRNHAIRAGLCLVMLTNGLIRATQAPPVISPGYGVVLAGTVTLAIGLAVEAWADLHTRRRLLEMGERDERDARSQPGRRGHDREGDRRA